MAANKPRDAFPITALIPEGVGRPIVVYEPQAALRLAIVDRDFVNLLDDTWDVPGVYCLLYPIPGTGKFQIYIGKAPAGMRNRIQNHVLGKVDGWIRAVLICKDTSHGFTSAHVGWLEGRLWSLAFASAKGEPTNKNRPKDETLPDYDRAVLETCVVPISRVLRLLGYGLEPEGEVPIIKAATARTNYGVTVLDLIKADYVHAGDPLVFTYPGHPASAVIQADGTLIVDGTPFDTLSAAGGALRGGPTNGWAYWAVTEPSGNQVPMADLRARLLAAKTPPGN
jgi:Restriction Enzyme Adenine Methylase Associated